MIELNISQLSKNIKAIQDASTELRALLVGEETMIEVARNAATIVKKRAGDGVDAGGVPFASYTDKYAEKREKSGRSTSPNLNWTGKMLNSIQGQFLGIGRAAVIFSRGEEGNKAAGNSHKRDFFDIRLPAEIASLLAVLDRRVQRIIKQLGLA